MVCGYNFKKTWFSQADIRKSNNHLGWHHQYINHTKTHQEEK